MELPGFRQAVGEVLSDADDGSLVDAVNIKGHAVGLLEGQRLQDSLFSIHTAAFPVRIALLALRLQKAPCHSLSPPVCWRFYLQW